MADLTETLGQRVTSGRQLLPLIQQLENSKDNDISLKGARGRYQIMPGTARDYGYDPAQLHDPVYAEKAAGDILDKLWDRFKGNPQDVLVAYNAGPSVARRWIATGRQGPLYAETQGYLNRAAPFLKVNGETPGNIVLPEPTVENPVLPNIPAWKPTAGQDALDKLAKSGFSNDDVQQYKDRTSAKLMSAGFKPQEVADYWGDTEPSPDPMAQLVKSNLEAVPADQKQKVASNPWEYAKAGWGMSVPSLIENGGKPDIVMPQKPGFAASLILQAGQMAGDAPLMGIGAIGGAAAGTALAPELPGIAQVVGAGAGAFGLPAAMREIVTDYQKRGEVHNFSDVLNMGMKSMTKVMKDTLTGGLSAGIGGKVSGAVGEAASAAYGPGVGKVFATGSDIVTQAATMVSAGSALEGKVPDASDYASAVVLGIGMHAAIHASGAALSEAGKIVSENMQEVYRDTGIPPWKLARDMGMDPVLRNEVLATDPYGNAIVQTARAYGEGEPDGFVPPPEVDVHSNEVWHSSTGLTISPNWMLEGRNKTQRVTRILPSGQVVPAPKAVASYLKKFGDLAGISFQVGPAKTDIFTRGEQGPSMWRAKIGRTQTADGSAFGKIFVYMPDTSLELNRRWYGLSTSEILFHEVGHALDARLLSAGRMELSGEPGGYKLSPELFAEARQMSQIFAPKLWKQNPQYREQHHEAMADAIAAWLSNPTIRGQFPLFEQHFGKLLEPYVDIVNKTLPRRVGDGQWERPEWDRYTSDEEMPDHQADQEEPPSGPEVIPPEPPDMPPEPPREGPPSNEQPDRHPPTEADLNEKASEFIGDNAKPKGSIVGWLKSRYRLWVSDLIDARSVDDLLVAQGANANTQMLFTDMVRQMRAATGRAYHYVQFGGLDPITFDKDGSPPVIRAAEIAKEDGGNMDDWLNYMVAKRALEKDEQGFETGHPLSVEDLHKLVEFGDSKYKRATNSLMHTMDSGLDYGRDSGVFSQDGVDMMRARNNTYVTWNRIIDDGAPAPLRSKRSGFFTRERIGLFEGGDQRIFNPLVATIDNLSLIIKLSDENRAKGVIVSLAESNGVPPEFGGLKQIPVPEEWIDIAGPNSEVFEPYNTKNMPTGDGTFTPFLAQRAFRKNGKPNQFLYYRNGVPELWEAENEHLATLLRGVETPNEAHDIFWLMDKAAKIQRDMIVLTPDFGVRNVIKDQVSAFVLDPNHPWPFMHFFGAFMDVWGAGPKYQDWMAKGGTGAALQEMGMDRLGRSVTEVFEKTGTFDNMWNTVRSPAQAWSMLQGIISSGYRKITRASEVSDEVSRVGFKEDMQKRGLDPIKAATQSHPAFLDFTEKGTSGIVASLVRKIPFAKPSILSVDQFVRGMAKDPMGVMLTGFVALTLPTIALNLMNYYQDEFDDSIPEDRKFRNISRYQKDGMMILPEIGGYRLKIPVGQTISPLFVGSVTRFMDHFAANDPDAFKKWGSMVLAQVIPPFIPSLLTPGVEQWANKSTWTGHPLIQAALEKISGPMQYTEATTEPAKALARVLHPLGVDVSPIIVENYARDLTGTLGMTMLKALNIPMKASGPAWGVADIPFVNSFIIRNPGMGAQPIQDFYDEWEKVQTAQGDLNLAIQRTTVGNAQGPSEMERSIAAMRFEKMGNLANAIHVSQVMVEGINNDATMTNAEKVRLTDDAYSNMVQFARTGLTIMSGKEISRTPFSNIANAIPGARTDAPAGR